MYMCTCVHDMISVNTLFLMHSSSRNLTAPPPAGAPPPGVDPSIYSWFITVDADRSGSITSAELQQALTNGNWSHFNAETCRLMIGGCALFLWCV